MISTILYLCFCQSISKTFCTDVYYIQILRSTGHILHKARVNKLSHYIVISLQWEPTLWISCSVVTSDAGYNIIRQADLCIVASVAMANLFFITVLVLFSSLQRIQAIPRGTVRLVRNGVTRQFYTSGRVQIYIRDQWGNICDDFQFSLTAATVICHQLGYTGASSQSRASSDS